MNDALRPQSFSNHRALPPVWFLLAGLVLAVDACYRAWLAVRAPGFGSVLGALSGVALVGVWIASRMRAMVVQNRVVRLETRLRLERLLGSARRAEIEALPLPQLVALRFASDAELPGLFERVRGGELIEPDAIKHAVRDWQADWLRI